MSSKIDFEKARKINKTKDNTTSFHVSKIPRNQPPTESQLELIAKLKQKLADVGKDTSYLVEPDTKFVAMHVINSLIRLCEKYHV